MRIARGGQLPGYPLFLAAEPAGEIVFGGTFDIEANREPAQGDCHENAGNECGHAGGRGKAHEGNVGCSSADGSDGIEVCALEDARHVAHESVAQHATAHGGEHTHHDTDKGVEAVDKCLVGTGCGVDANREDVEYGDKALGFIDNSGHDVDDGGSCDGDGERQRLFENVDIAHLKGHVAQKTSSKATYNGERDGSDKVEIALASCEYARNRRGDNGCQLEPDGDGNGLGVYRRRDHDGTKNAGYGVRKKGADSEHRHSRGQTICGERDGRGGFRVRVRALSYTSRTGIKTPLRLTV